MFSNVPSLNLTSKPTHKSDPLQQLFFKPASASVDQFNDYREVVLVYHLGVVNVVVSPYISS